MPDKLNLLPSDYEVSDSVNKVLKIIRPLNVILLAIFLTGALGMAGFFIFSSVSLNRLNDDNKKLTSQIATLQKAQQQIVLLKDRLTKIRTLNTTANAANDLDSVTPLFNSLSDKTTLNSVAVKPGDVKLSLNFRTNSDLSGFVTGLNANTAYSGVSLDNFGFSPSTGYQVDVSFKAK